MRTRIAGGLFVSHLRSETDLKSQNEKTQAKPEFFSINQFQDHRYKVGSKYHLAP